MASGDQQSEPPSKEEEKESLQDGGDGLSEADAEQVLERRGGSARVIHEVVRLEGEEELDRPALSLFFSGLVAGMAITASYQAEAFLRAGLPDAPWRPLIASAGYTLGFIIVIAGRLQLFTESTVTAVLPLASRPSLTRLGSTLRLWALVFTANMLGTLFVAGLMRTGLLVSGENYRALLGAAHEFADQPFGTILMRGIPAGFLVASIAWILPNGRESQVWIIFFLTYLIALGHLSHVVVGSCEAWMLWVDGQDSFGHALGGVILPALIGNIIGGSGLFAVLAHAQVRGELPHLTGGGE